MKEKLKALNANGRYSNILQFLHSSDNGLLIFICEGFMAVVEAGTSMSSLEKAIESAGVLLETARKQRLAA